MKNLFKTLSLIGLSLSLSVNAQTSSNKAKSQQDAPAASIKNDYKSAYLANQDYLSASSISGYNNFYGDSIKGFDENKAKTKLMAQGVGGAELQGHLQHLKRVYVNNKYGIGPKIVYMPGLSGNLTGSKPTTPNTSGTTPNGKQIGGGGNSVNVAPCVNEDFEASTPGVYTTSTGVTGWTISSRNQDGSCSPSGWTAGSSVFSLVATPILSWGSLSTIMGVIPNSPLGGTVVAQLNDHQTGDYDQTRMAQTFPVTSANTLFQFAYAGYWEDAGSSHPCCPNTAAQPGFSVKMYDCMGALLTCSNLSLNPGSGCQSANVSFSTTSNAYWSNWQTKYIDLTPYIGSCVTIEFIQSDCAYGGHFGSCLIDARCGGQLVGVGMNGNGGSIGGPVSFCAGANVAQITAPIGYSTYQWFAPGTGSIAAPQGTMSVLTVSNPIPGSVYTVQLVAASGCVFTSTNAIAFSTITIPGIGSTSTCPGGASGSATVAANGSGTGYNYTWINAMNSATVGTAAIVNNLGPGTYSVIVTAFGAAGCGSAVSTVTISNAPPGIISLLKPYCSNEAYLTTTGGSNFQWYNGLSPITPSLGGNNANYTVTAPSNGAIYWLSYLSSQGCQDSVKYTLIQSQPGLVQIPTPNLICPNGNNGIAQINLSPAPGAPSGLNSYSVWATGTTPAFTSSLWPTASNVYTVGGLQAGTYSVSVFDGSCKYGANFNIQALTFNFNMTPPGAILCSGNSAQISVSLTSSAPISNMQPSAFTYSWYPTTHLFGGTAPNAIVTPVVPIGTQTLITYSVTLTPTVVNCPVTKTFTILAVNPPIPTITAIPNLCNTFAPYTIVTNPPGGTFSTGITGTANPISSTGGVITPSLALNGVNTLTYHISQFGCFASNTATYQVSKFWPSALSSTVPPLCVTSPVFNLMNIVQNTQNGSWTGTPPNSITGGTTFNPLIFNSPSFPVNGTYTISYNTLSTPNPTVCPSSTQLGVSVTKTTTPVITQKPEFCTNAALFSMTVSPAGGGWLPNINSAISNAGVVNPTLVPVPGMIGTYTVADGPCINTNTTQLQVSQYNPAGFSSSIAPLCFNSPAVNLMSIVQATTNGAWTASVVSSTGIYNAIQSNTFFPLQLPTGVYTATYSTASNPNPLLCTDQRTIEISVLHPQTPVINQMPPMCNNASPLQLSVTPAGGIWTGSPYLTNTGLFTPSLTSPGNNAVQYIVGTSTCNLQETKFISIEAFVPATIVSQIPDLCNTTPILNLSPFTLSGQGVWSGPGISGTSFNPSLAGSGNFILMHSTASSPSGLCPDQATVAVNVYSLALPQIPAIPKMCNNAPPIQIQVSPVGGLFGGPDMGIVTLGGLFNPGAAIIGDNLINYSITSGPCVAYAQTVIKVEKFISAELAKQPTPFCKSDEPFNLNSLVQNPGGYWSQAPMSPAMSGSMFNPGQAYLNAVNTVTYYTHSETPDLCPDQREVKIEVRDSPVPLVTSVQTGSCVPVEVNFSSPTYNTGTGIWSFDDGSEPVQGYGGSHIFTTPGTFHIQYNYTSEIGCKALPFALNPVEAHEIPKADFSFPDEIYINEPQIQLTNLTSVLSNNTYEWKITGMSQPLNEVNQVVVFPRIGKFQVTLIATSPFACRDEITKTIEVKNIFNIFIPNSFSPNFDGLNDYFMPTFSKEGLDTRSFEMEIFDRWGHSLFHTKDALSKGWDGSVQNKGEALKEEVYVYRIKYKDMDGNAYNKMGHVSLVK